MPDEDGLQSVERERVEHGQVVLGSGAWCGQSSPAEHSLLEVGAVHMPVRAAGSDDKYVADSALSHLDNSKRLHCI